MTDLHTTAELDELECNAVQGGFCPAQDDLLKLIAAARRLEQLVSQMAFLQASGRCGADIMTLERIEAWAIETGWRPGKETP